jgi:hypothetical protein
LAEPLGDRCRLIVKLTSEAKDGPPPERAELQLKDDAGEAVRIQLPDGGMSVAPKHPDDEGVCVIGPFEPGRYRLTIDLSGDRHLDERLPLMKPGEERTLDIVCPAPAKKTTVMITAPPVPEDLRGSKISWHANFQQRPMSFEGHDWYLASDPERSLYVEFDPATGSAIRTNGVDVSDDAPEDRLAIVTAGTYRLSYTLQRAIPHPELGLGIREVTPVHRPDKEHADDPQFQFTAEPGENKWEIQVPDEFWDEARKKLAGSAADAGPADAAPAP